MSLEWRRQSVLKRDFPVLGVGGLAYPAIIYGSLSLQ